MEIWKVVSRTNKYIDETMPWALAKDESRKARLAAVLSNLAESIRIVSVLIQPFMPQTPAKIWSQLKISENLTSWESAGRVGLYAQYEPLTTGEIIFPRIDLAKELEALAALQGTPGDKASEKTPDKSEGKQGEKAPQKEKAASEADASAEEKSAGKELISIDDFAKLDLRVIQVLEAERVPKSDKLLKLKVKLGEEERQVVSGIAQYYQPEELVGKTLILVANLKPVKLKGVESQGMILAASDKASGKLTLVTVEGEIPSGTQVS